MKTKLFALLLSVILFGCGGGGGGSPTVVGDPYPPIIDNNVKNKFAIKSINLDLNNAIFVGLPGSLSMDDYISAIKSLGVTDVKVTLSAGYYDTPTDNSPDPSVNFNPPDDQILLFFQKLKAAGLTITMAPNVSQAIQNASNLLDVVHATPSNFDEWIYNHTIVMTKLASLAQAGSVDRFIVMGDEVQPSTYDISHHPGWLNLISAVRNVYKGEITTTLYSNGVKINGLDNIDMVGIDILSAVDTIGVGWFPEALTNTIDPTVASLINGWRNNGNGVDTIQYFQQLYAKYNKPVWISDIAFHSFAGDNIDSNVIYNNQVTLTVDQQEQANEIDSLLTVLSYNTGSWFLGIVIDSYHNFPSTDVGLPRFLSSPYSEDIKGKIAETVVRKWYRQIMY